ncbi:MAG TPA: DUF1178 family protein [Desulfobacteraceae bacterium]|nr:MAG: hypothetical protein B6I30_04170 [Desulfobacteraceae bacterium 4572_187]RLB84945.1 MAG: DUF1178 domain-containing protein [Deltaproteobacteria bacterium]HDL08620.1 DUF1178 family protein [Desulfobacteraceae bacterium]
MIAYDLQCINGHSFEGWFEDRKAYEKQKKNGFISCPICDSTSIARVPSTFAIKSSPSLKNFYDQHEDLENINRKIVNFVEKNFDNVGSDFTKEALKMHYGVIEPRNIRGVSTKEEEKTLKEEGVQFIKVPMPIVPDMDA